MPSTFIDLTNQLLRRLNEVEISQADFPSVRGVQALAKDAVKASVAKINQAEYEWPFNASEHTQVLAVGQEEYSWPVYFKVSDWNSFQIQANSGLGVGYQTLKYMDRDEWYANHRDDDMDAGAVGRGVPEYVFPTHGNGYGVTPSPDAAYTVKFRYYMNHTDLSAYDDQTRIPATYDNVIINGALYHFYMFRDNVEAAGVTAQIFQQGLKEMQSILINKYEYLTDTRIIRKVRAGA